MGDSFYRRNSASCIFGKVWVGSKPLCNVKLNKNWDLVVFAAVEYQPEQECFEDIDIIYAPIDDSGLSFTKKEIVIAKQAGKIVAKAIKNGDSVLSTCQKGLNRSTLIAALGMLYSGMQTNPDVVIAKCREVRGKHAFTNPEFEYFYRLEAAKFKTGKRG